MNKKSQLQFAQKCAVLLESGISLSEALSLITKIERNKKKQKFYLRLEEGVARGMTLSKIISESQEKINPVLVSLISFGEDAGILALTLRQAADLLEKSERTKKKLVGALIYPAFIGIATVLMTAFLVFFIFPKIVPLFASMNIKLPLLTRIIQYIYVSASTYGFYFLFMTVILFVTFFFSYRKNQNFRLKLQAYTLRLPVIGNLLKKVEIGTSCRSIGTLLKSGQSLPKTLRQIEQTTAIDIYQIMWQKIYEETIRGVQISQSLKHFIQIIPNIVPDMLMIGEKTGTLATMFLDIAHMFDEEIDSFTKDLGSVIEPVLMIGMGLIVGSVALSIILPIYEITSSLTH